MSDAEADEGRDGETQAAADKERSPTPEPIPITKEEKSRQMENAYNAVFAGMTAKPAARCYNVSYTSLLRRVRLRKNTPFGQGRKPRLSDENEQQLVECSLKRGRSPIPEPIPITNKEKSQQKLVEWCLKRERSPTPEPIPITSVEKGQQMEKAYNAVLRGMIAKPTAKHYHVSYTALLRRVKQGENLPFGKGRKPWINNENEEQLVEWCLNMVKIGCPLTKQLVPKVVKTFLDSKQDFLFPPDNLPTIRWVDRFISRHPVLSGRLPKQLRHLRAAVLPQHIKDFFSGLKQFLMDEHNLEAETFLSEENASRIFNCDQSEFFLNATAKSSRVMVRKRTKNADTFGKKSKTMISVLSCVSAAGDMLRPLILDQGEKPFAYQSYPDLDTNSYNIEYSDNGRMTMEVFYSWLTNLYHTELEEKNIQRPVILFVECLSIPISLETLAFARDNGIIMYCFPPQASHRIQPLDVSVLKPVKEAYRDAVSQSLGILTQGGPPKKYFPYLLMRAFKTCNMTQNIKSGFQCTGLVPFNPNAIKQDKFLQETVQETDPVESEEDSEEEEEVQEDRKTPAEYFAEGFIAGEKYSLERLEALVPPDLLDFYRERLRKDDTARNLELFFYAWRELTQTPPCPRNPYDVPVCPVAGPSGITSPVVSPSRLLSPVVSLSRLPSPVASPAGLSTPNAGTPNVVSDSQSAKVCKMKEREDFEESQFKKCLKKSLLLYAKQPQKLKESHPRALTAMSLLIDIERKAKEKQKRKEAREAKKLEKEKSKKRKRSQPNESSSSESEVYMTSDSDSDDNVVDMTSDSDDYDEFDGNACGKCGKRQGQANLWIGCERCPRWFHKSCVSVSLSLNNIDIRLLDFVCDKHAK